MGCDPFQNWCQKGSKFGNKDRLIRRRSQFWPLPHVDLLCHNFAILFRYLATDFFPAHHIPSVRPWLSVSYSSISSKARNIQSTMFWNRSKMSFKRTDCTEFAFTTLLDIIMNLTAAPGLHYEVANKMKSKRNDVLEKSILDWISQITGEKIPSGPYEEVLKNGVLICKLMEKLQPGSIGKFNEQPSQHFKAMENISKFTTAVVRFGVPELDIFKSDDLLDKRNIPQVTNTIVALGRSCYLHPEFQGPFFGPKPSEQNKRVLTDEQKLLAKQKANCAQLGL